LNGLRVRFHDPRGAGGLGRGGWRSLRHPVEAILPCRGVNPRRMGFR
jgi:hypothetical protein